MTDKYDRKDDPLVHLAKWAKAYGAKPQPEWVHLFCHTLDVIPMNWYLETELHHGIGEWDIMCEWFIMMFNFEHGFDCIDEALQEVKAVIFRIPHDHLDLVQPDWTTQLSHALEWHNVTAEEEDEDGGRLTVRKQEVTARLKNCRLRTLI